MASKEPRPPRVESLVLVRGLALCLRLALGLSLVGCATSQPSANATPLIVIRPGVPERIALMDQYRLGDDIRKRMMARPHVWVEEVPEDEVPKDTEESGESATLSPTSE
jgi:hypothetical protein